MRAEKITVLLPLVGSGKDEVLLEIEIKSFFDEPLLNAEALMKDSEFQQAFTVEISEREDL